jgi:hypothetical protein
LHTFLLLRYSHPCNRVAISSLVVSPDY